MYILYENTRDYMSDLNNGKHLYETGAFQLVNFTNVPQPVTLEWNAEDVADVFKSQFESSEIQPYDPIEGYQDSYNPGFDNCIRGDYVIADGKKWESLQADVLLFMSAG